jgi:hypothetical protein
MRASASSWIRTPFGDGIPMPYAVTFTAEQAALLTLGLIPKEMEDKWFIYFQ